MGLAAIPCEINHIWGKIVGAVAEVTAAHRGRRHNPQDAVMKASFSGLRVGAGFASCLERQKTSLSGCAWSPSIDRCRSCLGKMMAFVFNRWFALALYISTSSILVMAHGFAGTGSPFTAAFIAGSTLALFLLSRWADFRPDPCDFLFGIFVCSIAISFAINGMGPDRKEMALLLLSLAGYPAARLFGGSKAVAPSFVLLTAVIVVVAVAETIAPLIDQWSESYGKPHPLVFGQFGAATANFTNSLAYLMIALVCMRLTTARAALVSAAVMVPTAVFAAAFVRSEFLAIGVALLIAALTGRGRQRTHASIMICVLIGGVVLGNLARLEIAPTFSKYANRPATPTSWIQVDSAPLPQTGSAPPPPASGEQQPTTSPQPAESAPAHTSCPVVDLHNSIAIRKQLYLDALAIVPRAGLFGIGMDRFMDLSCIKNTEIHNTILQTIVELGWIAGAALVALMIFAIVSLWPLAARNSEARFALSGLIFIVLLSMGHGRISHDALLFMFLGYAAGLKRTARTCESDALRPAAGLTERS